MSSVRLPYIQEFNGGLKPVDVFDRLRNQPGCFYLDSGLVNKKLGGFSFVGCRPFLNIEGRNHDLTLTGPGHNPLEALWHACNSFHLDQDKYPVPFIGGAVGYLGYDAACYLERLPAEAEDDLKLPNLWFGLYDVVFAHDHLKNQSYIISTGLPELEESARVGRARSRCQEFKELMLNPLSCPLQCRPRTYISQASSNFTHEAYLSAVDRARRYIISGDIFEVNLSQRFEADLAMLPHELYFQLRSINPAPFAAYLDCSTFHIVSASPERFLRLRGHTVETRPIKGTRRRGGNPDEDKSLAAELLASVKDRAENMMIVDLSRNDLGRVCRYGTVKVTELATLETFPTVFHLTSTVIGELDDDLGWIDLLKAAFPGGSITGAPKVRAMEIIDELEPTRRGVYTGAIGYIGFDGAMDLNIAIRTIVTKGKRAYFQVGGAVTYDSDPQAEYEETLHKARALFKALGTNYDN